MESRSAAELSPLFCGSFLLKKNDTACRQRKSGQRNIRFSSTQRCHHSSMRSTQMSNSMRKCSIGCQSCRHGTHSQKLYGLTTRRRRDTRVQQPRSTQYWRTCLRSKSTATGVTSCSLASASQRWVFRAGALHLCAKEYSCAQPRASIDIYAVTRCRQAAFLPLVRPIRNRRLPRGASR